MTVAGGAFFRHPTLGLCKVERVDQAKVHVVLESGAKRVLTQHFVEKSCTEVLAAAVSPASPLLAVTSRARTGVGGTARRSLRVRDVGRSRACAHCAKPLNRSCYSADRRLKACPNCSAEPNSTQHVFYDDPGAFGTSDARSNDSTPEGVQSYCRACRDDERGEGGILCDAVSQ